MKKLSKVIVTLLLLLGSIFSVKTALADTVDITVSNPRLTQNSLRGADSTEFAFDFGVPNSAKSGDKTVISLPEELNFQRNQEFNVYAPDGQTVVASAVIDTATKTLTMIYTDYVDTHDEVTGSLSMIVRADTTKVTTNRKIPASITVNGNTFTIDSGGIDYNVGGDEDNVDFWKYGYVDYDTNEITYLINFNTRGASVSDVVIKDQINSAGLTYVEGSFRISEGTWRKNAQNYWALDNATDVTNNYNIVRSADNNAFSINFGNISKGYSIKYKVKASYDLVNGEQLKNAATYNSNSVQLNESKNTVYYQSANGQANGYNYDLTIKKVNEANEPLAGAEFTVTRKSNGQVVGTLTTGADGTATLSGLLKDEYVITETKAPDGYTIADPVTAVADNSTVTITDKRSTIDIAGTKTWDDNNDQDGLRPKSVKINLLANGEVVDSRTVTADDNWSYSFTGLKQYDDNGNQIVYTIAEDPVTGYTSTVDGYNITNTHTPETTEVSGQKTWSDNEDQDGKRPNSVTVNLLANGKQVDSQQVSADNNWAYSFTNLPKYADGKEIVYTVTEDAVDGYTTAINGYNITNSYTPGKTSFTVTKAWDDNNDQDGKRPKTIDVQLYANGEKSGDVVTLSVANNWTYTWTGLAQKAKKKDIVYTVKEVTKVDNYTTTVGNVENGNVTITNTHTPETTEVSGKKTWKDSDDQDGKRPSAITVNLLANGKKVDSQQVSADSNWAYSFTNLPKYADGKEIVYTVTEDAVDGYTTAINGYNITNSYTPGKTSFTVTKAWDDNNDQDGKRPKTIDVQLYANGEKSGDVVTLSAANNWTYTWTGLAQKTKKKDIVYTVKEVTKVDNYTTTVGNVENGNVTITNTHTPETTRVSGKKTWKDSDDQDGKRPSAITVNLLANGKKVDSQQVSADNNWAYSFTNLPKYADGKEIVYTVTEDTVSGYATTIDGYNITNSYTPGKTSFTVTKAWDDNNDQDGKRPKTIDVQLYANGEKSGDVVTLSAANNWTYTWTGLAQKAKKKDIVYTVKEVTKVDGYTTTVGNVENGNVTITNTHTPETTEVSGKKTWKDSDDQDGKRPSAITVNLLANGKQVDSQQVSADNNWAYSFTNLPKYADGKEIVYTVTEDTVSGYATTIDGYNITNSYTPGKTSFTVTKAWDDNNDQDGLRPKTIDVQLYANGEKSGDVVTLSAANNWTYTWTGLAQKAKKKDIVYTVKEVTKVEGYTTTVGNVENGNVTITNTHTPKKPTTPPKSSNKKSGFLPSSGSRSGIVLSILGAIIVVGALAGLAYYKVNK